MAAVCLNLGSLRACARAVGVPLAELLELTRDVDNLYVDDVRRKKDGGYGRLAKPRAKLKRVQKLIDRRVLRRLPVSPVAFGGVPGRNHIDGARMHAAGRDCVVCVDIRDYFPSVSHHRVHELLRGKGCAPDVARLLTRLVTWKGSLPLGSPASTTLANLLLEELDAFLASAPAVVGTRVVDDITVSGAARETFKAVEEVIQFVSRKGLRLNRKKFKIQMSGQRQQVTNLCINRRARLPKVSRNAEVLSEKQLRDAVRRGLRYGLRDEEKKRLRGQLNYFAQLDPRRARRLQEQFKKVERRHDGPTPRTDAPAIPA